MAKKKTGKPLLETYARLVSTDPLARSEAELRLQAVYESDPLRICYASECASKNVLFYGEVPQGARPDPNVVRVDFASWLVINRKQPDGKSAKLSEEQEWRLMERASGLQDKTLVFMMLEAGYSPLPPAIIQPLPLRAQLEAGYSPLQPASTRSRPLSALQIFCAPYVVPEWQADKTIKDITKGATASDVATFLKLVPAEQRAAVAGYTDERGFSAVHVATHNPNVGIITELHKAGADIGLVLNANGKPRRAAHMAVLAGNPAVTAEIGGIDPGQFGATPACPVTPYEMGMERIQANKSSVPREVPTNVKSVQMKNPMQESTPAHPGEAAALKARAEILDRVMRATDIAAGFIGLPVPFGNEQGAAAALRAAGHKRHTNALN